MMAVKCSGGGESSPQAWAGVLFDEPPRRVDFTADLFAVQTYMTGQEAIGPGMLAGMLGFLADERVDVGTQLGSSI